MGTVLRLRKKIFQGSLFLAFSASACSGLPASTASVPLLTPMPVLTQSPTPPAEMPVETDSRTPSPIPTQVNSTTPTAISTPVAPSYEPISITNISEIEVIGEFGNGIALYADYSPDGGSLVVSSPSGIYFYDPITLDFQNLIRTNDFVNEFSFSPDNAMLATTANNGAVRLWNVEDGSLIRTLENPTLRSSGSPIFTSDGQYLITGSGDSAVRLWRVSDGELVRTFKGYVYSHIRLQTFSAISLSADDRLLATTGSSNTIWIWEVSTGALVEKLEGNGVAFSPSESLLAASTQSDEGPIIEIRDTAGWQVEETLYGHKGEITTFVFTEDGRRLLSTDNWGTSKLWETTNWTVELGFEDTGEGDRFEVINFSPDGLNFLSISRYGRFEIRAAADATILRSIHSHVNAVNCLAVSPDGLYLAAGNDWSIQIWRVSDGTLLHVLEHGIATDLAFSPDGNYLASGAFLDGVRLWGVSDGELVRSLSAEGSVDSIDFSPDGSTLAVTSYSNGSDELNIWEIPGGKLSISLKVGFNSVVEYSPSGAALALGAWDQVILWNVSEEKISSILDRSFSQIRDLGFSDENTLLLTGIWNTEIWDSSTGTRLLDLPYPGDLLSPDFHLLVSITGPLNKSIEFRTILDAVENLQIMNLDTPIKAISFSSHQQALFVANHSGTVFVLVVHR